MNQSKPAAFKIQQRRKRSYKINIGKSIEVLSYPHQRSHIPCSTISVKLTMPNTFPSLITGALANSNFSNKRAQ